MQTSKALLLLLLSVNLLGLTACNLPTPKNKSSEPAEALDAGDTEAATFTIEAAPSRSTVLEATKEGAFALPTSKVFNLYACVKDVYYNKAITGHKFKIDEANKEVTSDNSGCIVWSEKIEYNYLADSQYIKIDRHVRGVGLHKGVRTVSFAINPWSHGENLAPVLDVKNEDAIPNLVKSAKASSMALKGLSADNVQRTRPLWLEEGRLFVTEQNLTASGVDLLVELRGTPSIQMTKMNGEVFLRSLTAGSFKVRMEMIHSYMDGGKEVHRLLSQTDDLDAKMENGSLAVRSPLSLSAIPTRGQLVLGLHLEPVDGPQGLKAFDGIYILGDYDQIKGSSFLKLSTQVAQDQNFQLNSYVNAQLMQVMQTTIDGTTQAPAEDAYQKPKIEVSQLEFKYIRIGEETTSTREVIYNIKACVKNGIDQKNARAATFKVTKFRQSEADTATTVDVRTDNNACVTWDESIKFKYFDCQRYLKGFVQIANDNLGMNEKLTIIVNPWDNTGAVGRDMRYVDPTEKLTLDCKAENRPRTQVVMDSFNYSTTSYNYQIDNLLNLSVVKKVQVKIEPRLLVYSSISNGRGEIQKLRDGVYLLKMAIVKNREYDNDQNTYVTSDEKFINVMSGQINAEMTFRAQDLKALGNRNNMLVEIYPVDESKVVMNGNSITLKQGTDLSTAIDTTSGLESPTFIGPVVLNADDTNRPLRILDASAVSSFLLTGNGKNESSTKGIVAQVVQQGKWAQAASYKKQLDRTSDAGFAKENNMALVNLHDMQPTTALTGALKIKPVNTRFVLSKAELQAIVSGGQLSRTTAQKLCSFWVSEFFPTQFAAKGGVFNNPLLATGFGSDCYHSKDSSRFFQVERRMSVKEVGGSRYLEGFNQGLSVGTAFSMSQAHSTYRTESVSISGKLGLSKKFFDLVSMGVDLGASISWSQSDSNSTSNAINVSTSTSLMVQQSRIKIRVNKFEQCALVSLNPSLFIKDTSWFGRKDYLSILNSSLTDAEKVTAVTRGLMICDGEVHNQPVDITENYYVIAQETNSTQMQDNGDERNRNFFVALRSTNDFNRFVLAIKGQTKMPDSSQKEKDLQKDASNMMERLFKMSGPSYPGMYLN